MRSWRALAIVALALLTPAVAFLARDLAAAPGPTVRSHVRGPVRVWVIGYRAHSGGSRLAYVDLPRWYRPQDDPPLPLVISPHGRGASPRANSALWGNLPAEGRFAVVNPQGEPYSWGDPGQIADLARLPRILVRALPWLRIDRARVYAIGASMGGQEALLLLARHPDLLAGVAAFDAPTDLALRYRDFSRLPCDSRCLRIWAGPIGRRMQQLMARELGGSPASDPAAYAARSPLDFARRIAFARVPVQLWWSRADQIVVDQARQSGRLYRRIKQFNPHAPVEEAVGTWGHAADFGDRGELPLALVGFGLLPPTLLDGPAAGGGEEPLAARVVRSSTVVVRSACETAADPLPGAPFLRRLARRRDGRSRALRYPWPVRPFDEPHPVRGNLGDPRTVLQLANLAFPRMRAHVSFHNGIDIAALPGTLVYPVVSGTAWVRSGDRVEVTAGRRTFEYWHIAPRVESGERVTAERTVLGFVLPRWSHLHFGETRDGLVVNPLAPGHLTPDADTTPPVVRAVRFRAPDGRELDPEALRGRVAIVASAYDLPSLPVSGAWRGFPVAPARVSWQMTTLSGRVVRPERLVVDFTRRLPPGRDFWKVYAWGTYQNFPAVGLHFFWRTPGRYLFALSQGFLDLTRFAPGAYVLRVRASDVCGNAGSLSERVRILARPAARP